jgi:hypothetical protein
VDCQILLIYLNLLSDRVGKKLDYRRTWEKLHTYSSLDGSLKSSHSQALQGIWKDIQDIQTSSNIQKQKFSSILFVSLRFGTRPSRMFKLFSNFRSSDCVYVCISHKRFQGNWSVFWSTLDPWDSVCRASSLQCVTVVRHERNLFHTSRRICRIDSVFRQLSWGQINGLNKVKGSV